MSDASDPASASRRANWVALRTLRQRANVVGRTDDGQPVYEIRSARLVLPPGAAHLHRLVRCSKCGREMPGAPMLSPADLDRPSNPLFCERCVRSAAKAPPARRAEAPPAPAPVVEAGPVDVADAAGDRLAAVEAHVDLITAQLSAPAAADPDRGDVSAAVAEVRSQVQALAGAQAAIRQELLEVMAGLPAPVTDIEATVRRLIDEAGAATRALLDAEREQFHAALAKAFNAIRAEITAIEQRLDLGSSRQDVLEEKLGGAADGAQLEIRELARAHGELHQQVVDLTASVISPPAGVDDLRAELSALGRRIDDQAATFAARLEAERDEVASALHDAGRQGPEALAEPLRDMARAREELERRLADITAVTSAQASRQDALERRIDELARPLPSPGTAGAGEERPFGDLMESLEAQLRAADERLARTFHDVGGE